MDKETFHREDERLDELFRESLGNMRAEPSAGVWKKISRTLLTREVLRFNFTNLPGVFWGIIPAAMVITGIILYVGVDSGDPTIGSPLAEVMIPARKVSSPVEPVITNSPAIYSSSDAITPEPLTSVTKPSAPAAEPMAAVAEPVASLTEPDASLTIPVAAVAEPLPLLNEPTASAALATPPAVNSPELVLPDVLTGMTSVDATLRLSNDLFPDMISSVASLPVSPPIIPLHQPVPQGLDIGVNITPDMVFYQNASGSFKYNYTFDLGARYRFGRFYLQSGLGMTYSTAIGNYAVSYLKNDSIGYYYDIQSYSIDPGNPSAGITFDTKQVTVYDSVQYYSDYNTKNRYFYLQIPLTLGYRIIEKPRWSLSVDAGMFYAYLLSVDEPAPTFTMSESRILEVQRLTPQRNLHSLGLSGGISVEYRFARNFYLLIEPTFKYYLQTVEESSSEGVRQPYSVGLRAGIWYRLNFKAKTK